tara:strand:+ start:533 stop:892 length:360 start_codon:yes stop_codon:yes gene_type:complete
MKTVLTDTNIILWTFNGGPDFREAIAKAMPGTEIAIPSCVISELKKLKTKDARTALNFCSDMEVVDIGNGYADDMLFEAAKNGNIIATNDKDLLYRLKKLKLNALKIREKNKLIPTEGI